MTDTISIKEIMGRFLGNTGMRANNMIPALALLLMELRVANKLQAKQLDMTEDELDEYRQDEFRALDVRNLIQ